MERKKLGIFLVSLCLLFGMFFLSGTLNLSSYKSVSADTVNFAGGTGTSSDPYQIANATQLTNLSTLVNDPVTNATYKSAYYVLTADIDLSGQEWVPIGTGIGGMYFYGHFDGDGYTISNLTITSHIENCISYGLFGWFVGASQSVKATINNIKLSNTNIDVEAPAGLSYFYVSTISGYIQYAQISNCISNSANIVTNYGYIGGIVGRATSSTISNCCNLSNINISANSFLYIGGISGVISDGIISNCVNTGNISASNNSRQISAGGISGHVGGTVGSLVTNCYNSGDISVTSSSSSVDILGGGISGTTNYSTKSNCYNTGDISVTSSGASSYACAGGISASITQTSISNCYNAGEISSNNDYYNTYSAGIAAQAWTISGYGSCPISYCYNIGLISSTGNNIHIGGISGSRSIINYCYALTGKGYTSLDNNSSSTITGSSITTETAMQTQSTYQYWDFVAETTNGTEDIWSLSSNINNGYPFLNNLNILSGNYILTYNYNYSEGGDFSELYEADSNITLETPTRENYNFVGWSDGTNSYSAGSTFVMPSSNVTLFAVWLSFDEQLGATNSSGTWSVSGVTSSGKKIKVTYENIKVGSTLFARVTNSSGETQFLEAISPAITADTTSGETYFSFVSEETVENCNIEIYSAEGYTLYNCGVVEVNAIGERITNSLETVYLDPAGTYGGNDFNSGETTYTPVATVEMAKTLAKRGGTIIFMSTLEITEDTILDFKDVKVTNASSCTTVIKIKNGANFIVNKFEFVSVVGYLLFSLSESSSLTLNNCNINTSKRIVLLYLKSKLIINESKFNCTDSAPISFHDVTNKNDSITIIVNESIFENFSCGTKGSIFVSYQFNYNNHTVSYVDITLNNCKFINNSGYLGAVAHLNAGSLTVNGGTYSGNTATVGGVFYINALDGATCPVSIKNASFTDNSTSGYYVLSSADYDIKHSGTGVDTDSKNNLCGAGVIFCSQPLFIEDCIFIDNSGDYNGRHGGGAILISGEDSSLDLVNSEFRGNYSGSFGGAVMVTKEGYLQNTYAKYANIKNCKFMGNSSSIDGGVIFVYVSQTIIESCEFISNECLYSDGGVLALTSVINSNIYNSVFNKNKSHSDGGAIYCSGSVKAYDCVFSNNQAGSFGGAAYSGIYYNCTFYFNVAHDGGAICNASAYDCEIYMNRANGAGGGTNIGLNYNCNIYQNSASHGGGTTDGVNYNCKIFKNYSTYNYGGTYNSSNYNSQIYQNYSSSYVTSTANAQFNTSFTQNVFINDISALTIETTTTFFSGSINISDNRVGAEYDELTFIVGSGTGTSVTIRIPKIVNGELVGGQEKNSIKVVKSFNIESNLQGNLVLNVTGATILAGFDPIVIDNSPRSDVYYSNENSANDFINVFNRVFTFENGTTYNIEYKSNYSADDDSVIYAQYKINSYYRLGAFIKIASTSANTASQKDKLDFIELKSSEYIQFSSNTLSSLSTTWSYLNIPNEVDLAKRYLILGCYDGTSENTFNIEVVNGKLQLTFGTGGEGKVFTSTEYVPANRIFRVRFVYNVTESVGNWSIEFASVDNGSSFSISMSGSISGSNLIDSVLLASNNLRVGCDYRADSSVFGTIQIFVYGNRTYFSNTNTNVSSGKQFINYSAYDTCAVANGTTDYSIEVTAFTPNSTITYSTDNITFSSEPITSNTAGRTRVYFRIEAEGYFTICGMRNIILVNSNTSVIKPSISSYGTPPVLTLSFDKTSFTADEDVTSLMSGYKMVDTNGQIVNGTFKAVGGAIDYTATTLVVRFYPTNAEKYSAIYYNVTASVKFTANDIYYVKVSGVSNFYLISNPTISSTIIAISLEQAVSFISNNGKIYFYTPYIVSSTISILADSKNITFVRNFIGEMFNISSTGSLQIGSKTMSGKIVLDGNNQLAEFALIMNEGTLKIYGNVVIKNAFNVNGLTGQGGAIYNNGIADLDFAEISNSRSLNLSSVGFGGAIYNSEIMKIANLKISNCLSTNGGAIYNTGTLNMTNCILDSNNGWYFSGNIFGCSIFSGGANSILKMTNCKVSNSYAVRSDASTIVETSTNVYGGGIYVGTNGIAEINYSTISACQARNGGGIYVQIDTTFTGNNIVIQKCISNNSGSALFTENADNVTLNDYSLVGNESSTGTILSGTEGLFSSTGSFILMNENLSYQTELENTFNSQNIDVKNTKIFAFFGIFSIIIVALFFGIKSQKNGKKHN